MTVWSLIGSEGVAAVAERAEDTPLIPIAVQDAAPGVAINGFPCQEVDGVRQGDHADGRMLTSRMCVRDMALRFNFIGYGEPVISPVRSEPIEVVKSGMLEIRDEHRRHAVK